MSWFVCASMCNNYVTYTVAMCLYFGQLQIAAMSTDAAAKYE